MSDSIKTYNYLVKQGNTVNWNASLDSYESQSGSFIMPNESKTIDIILRQYSGNDWIIWETVNPGDYTAIALFTPPEVENPIASLPPSSSDRGTYSVFKNASSSDYARVNIPINTVSNPYSFQFLSGDDTIDSVQYHFDKKLIKQIVYVKPGWITNARNMFRDCTNLTSIPQLDTSNVTDMSTMFLGCESLTTIPQLDTSNVTDMNGMFWGCESLTTIPQLDTYNVTDMRYMFWGCANLTTIPQLNTSNVTSMGGMFLGCESLTTIPQLNTSNVTDMSNMFQQCGSLTTIPQLDTSNVTGMSAMFRLCYNLTTIPQLDTSRVNSMIEMFHGCVTLTTIPQLNTSNVTNMNMMFKRCTSLTNIEGFTNLACDLDLSGSTNITRQSMLNIIQYAKTIPAGEVRTIKISEPVLNRLTEEDIVLFTNKGWTLSI